MKLKKAWTTDVKGVETIRTCLYGQIIKSIVGVYDINRYPETRFILRKKNLEYRDNKIGFDSNNVRQI